MAPGPKGKGRGKSGPPKALLRAAAAAAAAESSERADSASPASGKRRAEHELQRSKEEPDTELVFEDPYGDEYDDEDMDTPSVDPEKAPAIVDPMVANDAVVFRPGKDKVADGEKLVYDESAYDIFHTCMVEWPSLSFDFVCMNRDGEYNNLDPVSMDTYPLSISMVMGTQADTAKKNKLVCVKMSNMHRTGKSKRRTRTKKALDSESESSEEEDESDEESKGIVSLDRNPILQHADIRMDSTVNRVRVMPQRSNIVAAWTESGRVNLVDASPALDTLNLDSKRRMSMPNTTLPSSVKPFFVYSGHRIEGFGLDWSRVAPGRLLSGALNGGIYLHEPASESGSTWTTSPNRFRGHNGPVEDIQWSPNEPNVFASCSSDKSIQVWDARQYKKPALGIARAHDADVNVMSWNRIETHLVVSGGDDGIIRVWDLRSLDRTGDNTGAKPAAEFKQHQQAITAIQWHPKDSSMLCASSEDGTVTIWDLAVERDAEEELREGVVLSGADEFPPQLLFIHMGQKNIKDAQWHPACPSLIASTAEDGLNFFQPSNVTLPS